ncbi:Nif3-like dinuclear metal center hexameric protein [Pseudoclavibacter alba]|uniref:GTP cyclohydrolase 1 type 2 homolog n=1 Tax=Pseudoclavibacter albus TaxID=272241 RepID=A0ABT2HWG8_9MICO|nr:Nif3-like dinuclear metal center hexameric protein [Pseudoclavibacter alba]MCT2042480.1 Nif3-like dinuclear metal center hexameric protein [Pseudoclavibacter alba]
MVCTLRDMLETVEALWPKNGAEDWDKVGLVTGDPDAEITKVHLAVDPVRATVDEAIDAAASLLITHHPLLLRGVTSIAEDTYKGALLADLIRGNCALIAAHTNADVVEEGPTGVVMRKLGVENVRPMNPLKDRPERGIGLVGELPESEPLGRFAQRVAALLPATAQGIRVAGEYERPVTRVAMCSGAGDSLLGHPMVREADVYLTSDLRHHPASEALEQSLVTGGPALIDTAHWASEWVWLDGAAERIRARHPGVEVVVSELNTDPWTFLIPQ